MTGEAALAKLGDSTARAAVAVLEQLAPGQVQAGGVSVAPGDANPLEGVATPAVATSVSYVDGVVGGNVLVLPFEAARRLAAAMMGGEVPDAAPEGELSELERSAVGEAATQIMAGAAASTAAVLGTGVEIEPAQTRTFASLEEAAGAYPATPHAVRMTFTLCGESCRLLQLVPNAFVVRMTKALDELGAADLGLEPGGHDAHGPDALGPARRPSLRGISVRVSAELGRTRMPSAELVGLPPGAVVELDRHPDDAIDLFVNGRRFATGRLMVSGGSEWAVRIETVLPPASDPAGPALG